MKWDEIARLLGQEPTALAASLREATGVDHPLSADALLIRFAASFSRALNEATVLFDDRTTALQWMRDEPLAPFGGKTGVEMLMFEQEDKLVDYINSLLGGAAG